MKKNAYLSHFGLTQPPFSTTPDPNFAYASREHEKALLKIAYYVEEKQGMFLLMGEVGTGKTTVSELAVNAWKAQPERYVVGQVNDPSPRTPAAFLRNVLASFGLPIYRNLLDLKAALRLFLVEQYKEDRTVILMIDEAQKVHSSNLDTIHSMTNEQTQTQRLIQVVLLAQPNFKNKLVQHQALRSRIAGIGSLDALTLQDAMDLLRHRVEIAGGNFDEIFPPETHKLLYNATRGVPRDLCVLCNAALVDAYTQGRRQVDAELLREILSEYSVKDWGDADEEFSEADASFSEVAV